LHLAGGSKWHGRTRLADGIGVDATVSCAVRATARWLPVPIYAKANRPSARLDMDGNCRAKPRESIRYWMTVSDAHAPFSIAS
jgi:hypothetical protein